MKKEGQALSFYYLKRRTSIVIVPVSSADAAFVFNEQTGNYQAVTIQGQLTYRIIEPRRTMEMLNYVIEPRRREHVSQDPERLKQRIVVAVQMETRRQVERMSLEEALGNAASISEQVQEEVGSRGLLAPIGVELLSLNYHLRQPQPRGRQGPGGGVQGDPARAGRRGDLRAEGCGGRGGRQDQIERTGG